MIKKGIIFIGLVVLVVGVGGIAYANTIPVTIKFKNVSSAVVRYNNFMITPVTGTDSGTFRVFKSTSVTVTYTANEPYASSVKILDVASSPKTFVIDPYYSKKELTKQANDQADAIRTAVNLYSPSIPALYSIEGISMYHYGEWASAKLIWKGEETDNSDTLRVVVYKDNGRWSVVNRPDILLYQEYYKSVPIDILETVNTN